jgi:dsDNA-specific endonuclease/ATPase MutS2
MEVDLHIEALREEYAQLSNSEILRIQMNRFRTALEDAISNKAKRIVFIHGVGNGTLKLELRNELKRSYPECTYQDASFKEYGFGATLVHLR